MNISKAHKYLLPKIIIIFVITQVNYSLYIIDSDHTRMIELRFNNEPYCLVNKNRGRIKTHMDSIEHNRIMFVNHTTIRSFERICETGQMKNIVQFGFIFPGTKWCGSGNIAKSFNDLGDKKEEDKCCREHDQCPIFLKIRQCKFGLCNPSPVTRSHCDCDNKFKHCLQHVHSDTADTIGTLFFNIAQISCLREIDFCGFQSIYKPGNLYPNEITRRTTCSLYKYQRSAKYHPIKRKKIHFVDANSLKLTGYSTENPVISVLKQILFL